MKEVRLLSCLLQVCFLILTKLMCPKLCLLLQDHVRITVCITSGESPDLDLHPLLIDFSRLPSQGHSSLVIWDSLMPEFCVSKMLLLALHHAGIL